MITLIAAICAACGLVSWLTFALLVPALFLAETGFLWVLYLAVMRLQQVRDAGRFPAEAAPIAKCILGCGLFVDFAYNMTWATVLFLDVPCEMLVTRRLERYRYGHDIAAWRRRLTEWFSRVMLDPFDPSGLHVRP